MSGQFHPTQNRVTTELLEGLRRFAHPTLLIWAAENPHFGPEWGQRLLADIPGAVRLKAPLETGQLLMADRPERVADLIGGFLDELPAEQYGHALAG